MLFTYLPSPSTMLEGSWRSLSCGWLRAGRREGGCCYRQWRSGQCWRRRGGLSESSPCYGSPKCSPAESCRGDRDSLHQIELLSSHQIGISDSVSSSITEFLFPVQVSCSVRLVKVVMRSMSFTIIERQTRERSTRQRLRRQEKPSLCYLNIWSFCGIIFYSGLIIISEKLSVIQWDDVDVFSPLYRWERID